MYSEQLMNYLYHYQLEETAPEPEIQDKKTKTELSVPIVRVLKSAYATVPIGNEKQGRA